MYIHKWVLFVQYSWQLFSTHSIFSIRMRQGKFLSQIQIWFLKLNYLRSHPTGIKWPSFINTQSWVLIFKKFLDNGRKHRLRSWILIGGRRPSHGLLFSYEAEHHCHTQSHHTKHNHVQCIVTGVFEHLDSQIRVV